jgi:hypothetical protein
VIDLVLVVFSADSCRFLPEYLHLALPVHNRPVCLYLDDAIRIEMVEHIPLVAEFSRAHLSSDVDVVSAHLLPIILQFLNDPNSQVETCVMCVQTF